MTLFIKNRTLYLIFFSGNYECLLATIKKLWSLKSIKSDLTSINGFGKIISKLEETDSLSMERDRGRKSVLAGAGDNETEK